MVACFWFVFNHYSTSIEMVLVTIDLGGCNPTFWKTPVSDDWSFANYVLQALIQTLQVDPRPWTWMCSFSMQIQSASTKSYSRDFAANSMTCRLETNHKYGLSRKKRRMRNPNGTPKKGQSCSKELGTLAATKSQRWILRSNQVTGWKQPSNVILYCVFSLSSHGWTIRLPHIYWTNLPAIYINI